MSKVNVEALENIFRTLFSALNVTKMDSSEVNSVLDNLVDETSTDEPHQNEPIIAKKVGNTLILTGNFKISD